VSPRRESTGGADLLDAVLYDHLLISERESLERAHLSPSNLFDVPDVAWGHDVR